MVHLILTGATGLVGTAVLDAMLKTSAITRISILSRRPVKMATDASDDTNRINIIIHKDFSSYPSEVLSQLSDADGCVWALGVSQTAVGKDDYIKITKDYGLAAANAFGGVVKDKPFNFVYVSGEGATHTPGMMTPIFGRVKGETELALAEMRKQHPNIRASTVRPGFVDVKEHGEIKQHVPEVGMGKAALLAGLGPLLRGMGRDSPTAPLGRFLTEMAMGTWDDKLQGAGVSKIGDFPVVDNAGFRRLMDL